MNPLKFALSLVLLSSLAACSSVKYTDLAKPTPAGTTLNQGYSILSYLMKDESNVDKVLWIKDAKPATTELIQKIAKTARETQAQLENLSSNKPAVSLTTRGLPPIETETRDAISTSTAKQLLGNSGMQFELHLLLTQMQATNYALHLCQVLSSSDPNPERASYLRKQEKTFLGLREQTVQLIGNF